MLTVSKRAIEITAANQTKTYGDEFEFAGNEYEISSGSLAAGDTIASVAFDCAGAPAAAPYKAEGYPIVASGATGAGLDNYSITYVDGLMTIGRAVVTVTADDKSKNYGEDDPVLTATVTGLVNNEDESLIAYALSREAGDGAGTYEIEPTGEETQGNYAVVYETGVFTINRATVTVTAVDAAKVYGANDPAFVANATGYLLGDTFEVVYTVSREPGEDVGEYSIVPSGEAEQGNYAVVYENAVLAISPAAARVVVDAKTKTYGSADPKLTATVEGLVNGDGADAIAYTLSREAGEDAGTYAIAASGAALQGNYAVEYAPAALTVVRAVATVTALDAAKVYGEEDPEFVATVEGLANGDDASAIAYVISREAGEVVGEYSILPSGEAVQGNYTVEFAPGKFAISKAALTIAADDKSKTYGENDPELTATVTGLVEWDEAELVLDYTLSREAGEDAGTYAITPVFEGALDNYTVECEPGTLAILPAAVTVAANGAAKIYGEPDPEFTATVSGLIGDEDVGAIAYSISREAGEDAGTYEIIPSGAAVQGNYAVEYVTGTLTIGRLGVVVTADDATKTYGEADPEFTAKVEGLVEGDDESAIEYAISREPGEDVGAYAIVLSGEEEQGNYLVTYENGVLAISRATATVRADGKSKTVGEADPELTATIEGLAAWDDESAIVYDEPVREPGEEIGSYAISVTGEEEQGNYLVTYEPGVFEIVEKQNLAASFDTAVSSELNWDTGLVDLTFTITNAGEGAASADSDYWVELLPGPEGSGERAYVANTYCIDSPDGVTTNGSDYVDLTAEIKAALAATGNCDEAFDPGETVTLGGVSLYHWKRWSAEKFTDTDDLFKAGELAGTEKDGEATGATTASAVLAEEAPGTAEAAQPSLFPSGIETIGEFTAATAATYNGWLRDADGKIAALVKVVTSAVRREGAPARATITVTPFDGSRKRILRTSFAPGSNPVDEFGIVYGNLGLSGEFDGCTVEAARDFAKAKARSPERALAQSMPVGTWTLAFEDSAGFSSFSVKVAKNGKAKVTGTLSGSAKVTASVQGVLGEDHLFAVPVVNARKGVGFVLWIGEDGSLAVTDVATTGWTPVACGAPGAFAGADALEFDIPAWRSYTGEVNALRVSFNARTGAASGSFKLPYAQDGRTRADTVKLSGVVVGGRLYATATVRRLGSFKVTTEK